MANKLSLKHVSILRKEEWFQVHTLDNQPSRKHPKQCFPSLCCMDWDLLLTTIRNNTETVELFSESRTIKFQLSYITDNNINQTIHESRTIESIQQGRQTSIISKTEIPTPHQLWTVSFKTKKKKKKKPCLKHTWRQPHWEL